VGTAEANLTVAESNLESARASYANQEANIVRARAVAANDTRNADRLEDLHGRGLIASAGLSQRDVAQAALFSLNSNSSVNPSIYTDPRTGNQYNVVVQLDRQSVV